MLCELGESQLDICGLELLELLPRLVVQASSLQGRDLCVQRLRHHRVAEPELIGAPRAVGDQVG